MMERVPDRNGLAREIGAVPRSGTGYSTSFFAPPARIDDWIAAGTLSILRSEGALLIIRRDDGVVRVHHVASDPAALGRALATLAGSMRGSLLVADLVGRPEQLVDVEEAYRGNGFVLHACLQRMQRAQPFGLPPNASADVESAAMQDVPRLRAFMERWLDPLSEQIQQPAELAEAVAAGQVLVVRDHGELAGMLIHETTGFSTVLRYWHVDGRQRGRGVGARLMRAFLGRCASSRRIVLWVIADNSDAIAKYRHYGFREEALTDKIMARKPEQAPR